MGDRDEDGMIRRVFLRGAGALAAAGALGAGCGDDADAADGTGGASSGTDGSTSGTATSGSGTGSGAGSATSTGPGGGATGTGSGTGAPTSSSSGGEGGAGGGGGQGGAGGGTPSCEETEDDIEGPFYSEGAPFVEGALPGAEALPGVGFLLRGRVHSAGTCTPLAGAVLDIWQANDDGAYDNVGFTLRGRVETDAEGHFEVWTIVPGNYLNGAQYRPAHIHVKASAPGHVLLTTQLYFPDDPYNDIDPWFDPRLLIAMQDIKGAVTGTFDFFLVEA